jgi:hypothetical protein
MHAVRNELLPAAQHLDLTKPALAGGLGRLTLGRSVEQKPATGILAPPDRRLAEQPQRQFGARRATVGSSTSTSTARSASHKTPLFNATVSTGSTTAAGGSRRARSCQASPLGLLPALSKL